MFFTIWCITWNMVKIYFFIVLGCLDQLEISQLYPIELLGLLTGLGLLEMYDLIYPRVLTGFGKVVFFTNLSHGISGQIFGLISSFLSNRQLWVVLDVKSSQKYPVNAGVPQGSILGPTPFLRMLFVKLLSIMMTLFSIVSVIRQLICGNSLNWLLNFNLTYETLWTGLRSGLLISMVGKLDWFRLTSLITIVLLLWKWMCQFLRKNHLLRW